MKDNTKTNLMSISKNVRLPFKDKISRILRKCKVLISHKYIIIDDVWYYNAYITLQDMSNDP